MLFLCAYLYSHRTGILYIPTTVIELRVRARHGAAAAGLQAMGPLLDVAIVGGGPGGLAAAKSILTARPDLRVAVFERSTNIKAPRGASLGLLPNGFRALQVGGRLSQAFSKVAAPLAKPTTMQGDKPKQAAKTAMYQLCCPAFVSSLGQLSPSR